MLLFILLVFVQYSNGIHFDSDGKIISDGDSVKNSTDDVNEPPSSMASLAFVFDVTGSMSTELDQVKSGAKKILKTISEHEEKIIYNYIFVPFGDPNIGPSIATTNTTEFREILGELTVERGGDCPEMSLGGIKKSLELSLPNSYIYVFTDAHPKDTYLLADVLALVQKKNCQIVFVLTGNCDDGQDPEEYVKIAAVSTGQIFDLFKNDVHQVLEFIRLSLRSHKVNLLSVDGDGNSTGTYTVPIDETLKELTISLAGKKTFINVTDALGFRVDGTSKAHMLLNLENIKIINIQYPKPGIWKISVRSVSSYYTLRTTGQSNFSFVHGFSVEWVTSINETNHRPLKDFPNYLFLAPTDSKHIINFTVCEIVALNGTVINTIFLQKMGDDYNIYYGQFVPNNTNFHLQVSGVTKNGSFIRRITTSAVSSESAKAPIITLPDEQILKKTYSNSLICRVESLVPFTVRWLKNGELLNSSKYNQSATAIHQLPEPSLADSGNYSCEAINENGTSVAYANVQVIELPIIKEHTSEKIVVRLDDDVGIPCSAAGFPPPIIKWLINYTRVIENGNFGALALDNLVILPDKTLFLMNVTSNMSANYTCVAENNAGADYRHYEIVIVDENQLEPGVILIQVSEAEKALINCPAAEKNSHIQWLKDHSPLDMKCNERADEPHYILKDEGKVLKIPEVLVPPYFFEYSEDILVTVSENDRIMLNCTAEGYPVPKVIWKKTDLMWPVNQWTLANVTFKTFSKQFLVINQANKEIHSGNYTCLVKNKLSTIQRSFRLNVR